MKLVTDSAENGFWCGRAEDNDIVVANVISRKARFHLADLTAVSMMLDDGCVLVGRVP
jgi:hypothetical protein